MGERFPSGKGTQQSRFRSIWTWLIFKCFLPNQFPCVVTYHEDSCVILDCPLNLHINCPSSQQSITCSFLYLLQSSFLIAKKIINDSWTVEHCEEATAPFIYLSRPNVPLRSPQAYIAWIISGLLWLKSQHCSPVTVGFTPQEPLYTLVLPDHSSHPSTVNIIMFVKPHAFPCPSTSEENFILRC